jgi:transposase
MSNVLSSDKQQQVLALGRLGWSLRRIEEALGVRRETAARYLKAAGVLIRAPRSRRLAKAASEVSPDPAAEALAAMLVHRQAAGPTASPQASACEPWRDQILAWVRAGRTAKSIYEDLVDDHDFGAGYSSVKRFVGKLRAASDPDDAHPVITSAAGEEAQVDYGDGPMVRDPQTGKYRRTRMFVLVLGYSRKAVRLLTWRSSTRTWAELHEQAFARLGGAPRVVVLDNLREGVLKPDIYDPDLNPLYRDMLAHYGAVALACRVGHSDRKGKVESGVKHAKLKVRGLRFESLAEAQAYIDRWEERWADTRIHGTTKRQVAALFAEERPHLLALPAERFRYYEFGKRTVHLDGYVEVARAYYAPPPGNIGRELAVQWDSTHVRILDPVTGSLLREHVRTGPGGRRIRQEDRPRKTPPGVLALLARAEKAGKSIGRLCAVIHEQRREAGVRQIQGVLGLAKKHGVPATEDACAAALELGAVASEYRFVRRYLERVAGSLPSIKQVDPLIRDLTYYRDIINARTGGDPQ